MVTDVNVLAVSIAVLIFAVVLHRVFYFESIDPLLYKVKRLFRKPSYFHNPNSTKENKGRV